MPILYIMVGLPGAGKSTFIHNFLINKPNTVCVSRDEIRFSLLKEGEVYFSHENQVFTTYANNICKYLREGYDVIADATQLSAGSRHKLIRALTDRQMFITDYNIIFYCFNISVDTCIMRDMRRVGNAHVGEDGIRSMAKSLTFPKLTDYANIKKVCIINE